MFKNKQLDLQIFNIFASKPSLKNSLNLKIPIFVISRNFFWSLFQFEQLPPKNHHHQRNQESQLGKCYHIPAKNEGEKNLMAMLISRNLLRAFFLSWAFSFARVQASFSLCTWFSIKKKKCKICCRNKTYLIFYFYLKILEIWGPPSAFPLWWWIPRQSSACSP